MPFEDSSLSQSSLSQSSLSQSIRSQWRDLRERGHCLLRRYVNTMANLLAPRLVQPHLKATAAGLMAICYQTAHFLGLVIATVAALLMYGHIGVG